MDIKGVFANTPKKQVYLLLGLVSMGIAAGWWFYVYQPARQRRDELLGQVARLQQYLFQTESISRELPRLDAARSAFQREIDKAISRLFEIRDNVAHNR